MSTRAVDYRPLCVHQISPLTTIHDLILVRILRRPDAWSHIISHVQLVHTRWYQILLRGTIVNRTYAIYKNLYILPFFSNNIWSYLLWSPANRYVCMISQESLTRTGMLSATITCRKSATLHRLMQLYAGRRLDMYAGCAFPACFRI